MSDIAWFKVDDKLWGHPKWLGTPARARGLWVTAGSWSAAMNTDGFVPAHVLGALSGRRDDAVQLVSAGLWDAVEGGWAFHDWAVFQPDSASQKAKRDAESQGGELGNHVRWHVKKGITVPSCAHCQASGTRSGKGRVAESPPNPPVPARPDPIEQPLLSPVADAPADQSIREDVERICTHLADRIEANGAKRPTITKAWRDSARLLLDKDKHTEHQIAWLINWTTSDSFWKANVLSMPKFRDKFDQLRLKAMSERPQEQPRVINTQQWLGR